MTYRIKGLTPPEYGTGLRRSKYNFSTLVVGEAEVVPYRDAAKARSAINTYKGKRGAGKVFQIWKGVDPRDASVEVAFVMRLEDEYDRSGMLKDHDA